MQLGKWKLEKNEGAITNGQPRYTGNKVGSKTQFADKQTKRARTPQIPGSEPRYSWKLSVELH